VRNILLVLALIAIVYSKIYKPIPGKYIFVYHTNTTAEEREKSMMNFLADSPSHKIEHVYAIGKSFFGFAAETSALYVSGVLRSNPLFNYVEQDFEVGIAQNPCVTQTGATWGIDRISERDLPLKQTFSYEYTGKDVDSYIIDTGIFVTHTEFQGRAVFGTNTVGDGNNNDCNGHGTHVAGTVGSITYGIAKGTSLIAVKVLNCAGSGSYAGVIAGINWSVTNMKKTGKKSVSNMSLGGGYYKPVNDAVDAAVGEGMTMVVAAGNDNGDACNTSPASALYALTVGATTITDARSGFSNFGMCVDVFAPGTSILSTWNNGGTRVISGTSMAAPHVAGIAALYFEKVPSGSPASFLADLTDNGSKDYINLSCGSNIACLESPNILAHFSCDIGF
jgi:subtilisin family serine protease